MKKFLTRIYHLYVMSDRFPRIRKSVLTVLDYILYPELRLKEFFIRQQIKRLVVISFISLFLLMIFEITTFERRLGNIRHKLKTSEKTVDSLKFNARSVVYKEVADSFRWAPDYLRYKIYKNTGMVIPDKVSDNNVVAMVFESETRGIPLKLMLRVIKHESGFDSLAANPASSAWGYMQTLNSTFEWYYRGLKLTGGKTAANNIRVGAQLLKDGYDYWHAHKHKDNECWELSLACYAIGDSLPKAINRVPESVRDYVDYVMYNDK